jgi:hypothetical protein
MADEKKPKERKKKIEPEAEGSAPAAKKTKDTTASKKAPVEAVVEPAPAKPQTKSTKVPKLEKKNKSRLPRRQKKALQKAANRQGKA